MVIRSFSEFSGFIARIILLDGSYCEALTFSRTDRRRQKFERSLEFRSAFCVVGRARDF